ncbi:hypothetical protein JHK82_048454 [Glycine max]|nr:hypothetical protein JHK82_048454 [Glycine max]
MEVCLGEEGEEGFTPKMSYAFSRTYVRLEHGWKVSRKANKAGYFRDRYFSVLSSLQTSCAHSRLLQSKTDIERFIESNFPTMNVEEFFD